VVVDKKRPKMKLPSAF